MNLNFIIVLLPANFEDPSDVFKFLTFNDYEGMRGMAEGA